ncbi:MAG: single-stranded-DNA-specific exonuclease RecJ [Clostridia bacterium]|nr:single-stranded-DNA-specific exonuclease RecJ [Clostridia bacterium]
MKFKRWIVEPPLKSLAAELAEECNVDPFIALIAAGRGYTEPELLEEFLTDEVILSDPYELTDIETAAQIINDAVYSEERIAVFGDYDVDGVTATAIMFSYLKNRGARVSYYIPDREREGYGINISAIDKLKDEGVTLIVTVDNGIAANAEIDYAKRLGIRVVVTDHHLPQGELPEADAVVNPHRADDQSYFKDICGAFVAFKVVCTVEGKTPEEMLYEYGDLVALGTVADVMPLVNENRAIVREGVSFIANGSRRGLTALLRAAGIEPETLTASKLAFGIAPRINAAGRVGDASRAAELLLTDDDEVATGLASVLNNENIRRQGLEKQIFAEAAEIIEKKGYKHNRVIVVAGENWHGGVLGIVASRLCEKYSRPAIVLSTVDGIAHGSARSIKGFSIYEALKECAHILSKFGGHEMAAGLTIYEDQIDYFRTAINDYAASLPKILPELRLDLKLNPVALSVDLAEDIKIFEPFGTGNPTVLFGIFGLTLQKISPVGQGKHLRITFAKEETTFSAMLFGTTPAEFEYDIGDRVDIAVNIDTNMFGGNQSLTVQIKDIRNSNINEEKLIHELALYEDFKSGVQKDFSEILPTRQEVGVVYKQLLKKGMSLDRLITLNLATIGYAKTLVAAKALCELKFCSLFNVEGTMVIKVVNAEIKANLDDAKILKQLRGEFVGA